MGNAKLCVKKITLQLYGDNLEKLIELLKENKIEYLENEPMNKHTTFRIGGPAKLMIIPEGEDQLAFVVKKCKELGVRIFPLGKGSNLLVSDSGIDAAVILIGKGLGGIRLLDDTTIFAGAGEALIKVCSFALENSLTGLEFAYGIPGSCGGAAFMNAGAYGGEMKDVLYKCSHIDKDGNKGFLENDELSLSYRSSAYQNNGCIVTGLYMKLKKGDKAEIKAKMNELMKKRRDKQPLEYPSAGSTFKRPPGNFAGSLIESCGLKGKSVGGAQVSEKHAGFVINKSGNATCSDVLTLCREISDTVFEKTGVRLEREIRVTE